MEQARSRNPIGNVRTAKDDVPEMPSDTAEIISEASAIQGMGDYMERLVELQTGKQSL